MKRINNPKSSTPPQNDLSKEPRSSNGGFCLWDDV